jgi:hypothetical protein
MRPTRLLALFFALLLLLTLVMLGCEATSTSRPARGPDGKRWFSITCRDKQADCLAEAAMRCPKGYRTPEAGDAGAGSTPADAPADAPFTGRMMVRCKLVAVEGTFRECLGDETCDLGEKCAFPPDAGVFYTGTGRCQVPGPK